MLPIKDEEESSDEVGPLVLSKLLEEVIMNFLQDKDIDKLVTLVS
jgi:predicted house-cleaning noncanonical NTP pyrophosphatase (MazG superfamily)